MRRKRFQLDGPFCVAASLTFHAGVAFAIGWVSLHASVKVIQRETQPTVTLRLRLERPDTAEASPSSGGTAGGSHAEHSEIMAMGAGASEVEQPVRPFSPAAAQVVQAPEPVKPIEPVVAEAVKVVAAPPMPEPTPAPVVAAAVKTNAAAGAANGDGDSRARVALGAGSGAGVNVGNGIGAGRGDQIGNEAGNGNGGSGTGGDAEAEAISVAKPNYPTIARQRGQTGVVVVAIRVRADGSIGEVTIAESSGYPKLDQAALDAAKISRFAPAKKAGVATDCVMRWRFRFALESASR